MYLYLQHQRYTNGGRGDKYHNDLVKTTIDMTTCIINELLLGILDEDSMKTYSFHPKIKSSHPI